MLPIDLPGLPPYDTIEKRANAFLRDEGSDWSVDETQPFLANPLQGLWVVSIVPPYGGRTEGGGLVVGLEEVRYVSSAPDDDAYVGLEQPTDEVDEAEAAVNEVEMAGLLTLFASADDGEFSDTVCIMAVPAQDDPVHDIGPTDKHATLLYFGDMHSHADPELMGGSKAWLSQVLAALADKIPPFTSPVTGVEPLGDAVVWLLDSPNLQDLFSGIRAADKQIDDLYEGADATRFPEYTPHVSIGNGPMPDEQSAEEHDDPAVISDEDFDDAHTVKGIMFDRLSLWWGNEHIDFRLTGDPDTTEFEALFSLIASLHPAEFPNLLRYLTRSTEG